MCPYGCGNSVRSFMSPGMFAALLLYTWFFLYFFTIFHNKKTRKPVYFHTIIDCSNVGAQGTSSGVTSSVGTLDQWQWQNVDWVYVLMKMHCCQPEIRFVVLPCVVLNIETIQSASNATFHLLVEWVFLMVLKDLFLYVTCMCEGKHVLC